MVNIMAIDFHKAFNRMNHASCLEALEKLGAERHVTQMIAAFLHNRRMTVKINDAFSEPRLVNGGAPQGSILACFLFCATVNDMIEPPPREDLSDSGSFHTARGSLSTASEVSLPDLTMIEPDLSKVSGAASDEDDKNMATKVKG